MGLGSGAQLRKLEHVDVVLREKVEGPNTTWLEYVFLVHQASSEVHPSSVNLEVSFLKKTLKAPVMITGMTGGALGTEEINSKLAQVAEKFGIALGVGSQRAAIEDPRLEQTFRIVREYARNVPVVGNIGGHEFVKYDLNQISRLVDMINADALAVHLNLTQEVAQPEGTPDFRGLITKVRLVTKELSTPIMIKEVGQGLSYEVVRELSGAGIKLFDVAGAGGTNWVLVEKYRAQRMNDKLKELIAVNIAEWGIPTAASIIEARKAAPDSIIVGSGGIRSSVDAVKALRIGADLVGLATPVLRAYYGGYLEEFLQAFIHGIRALTALTGSKNLNELRRKPVIITSILREWLLSRGFSL
ncbi:MAG: type 2 isopentenyl-diphosphate Delta-isomerase [Desulfurococcaceae archaeon TW002]